MSRSSLGKLVDLGNGVLVVRRKRNQSGLLLRQFVRGVERSSAQFALRVAALVTRRTSPDVVGDWHRRRQIEAFPLWAAVLCEDCRQVSCTKRHRCPVCGSSAVWSLVRVLEQSEVDVVVEKLLQLSQKRMETEDE
jgi:hypothetical protein